MVIENPDKPDYSSELAELLRELNKTTEVGLLAVKISVDGLHADVAKLDSRLDEVSKAVYVDVAKLDSRFDEARTLVKTVGWVVGGSVPVVVALIGLGAWGAFGAFVGQPRNVLVAQVLNLVAQMTELSETDKMYMTDSLNGLLWSVNDLPSVSPDWTDSGERKRASLDSLIEEGKIRRIASFDLTWDRGTKPAVIHLLESDDLESFHNVLLLSDANGFCEFRPPALALSASHDIDARVCFKHALSPDGMLEMVVLRKPISPTVSPVQ